MASKVNFKVDKGIDKKADTLASEVAQKWCQENSDWVYTGKWKNERSPDG